MPGSTIRRPYLRFADEALAIFRELGDAAALPTAIQNLGWAQLQTGHLEASAANLSEARNLDVDRGDLQGAANAMMGLGVLAVMEGRPAKARSLYTDALKIFKDLGNTYYVGLVECMLAQCDQNEGDFDAAENRIRLGLSAYPEIENVMGTAWALYMLARPRPPTGATGASASAGRVIRRASQAGRRRTSGTRRRHDRRHRHSSTRTSRRLDRRIRLRGGTVHVLRRRCDVRLAPRVGTPRWRR